MDGKWLVPHVVASACRLGAQDLHDAELLHSTSVEHDDEKAAALIAGSLPHVRAVELHKGTLYHDMAKDSRQLLVSRTLWSDLPMSERMRSDTLRFVARPPAIVWQSQQTKWTNFPGRFFALLDEPTPETADPCCPSGSAA